MSIQCPKLISRCKNSNDRDKWQTLATVNPILVPEDGIWFTFTSTFTFTKEENDVDSVFAVIFIEGPEPGVDIGIDDVKLMLPPKGLYHDRDELDRICCDLAPKQQQYHEDDDFTNDVVPFPFYSNRHDAILTFNYDESGRWFYRSFGRRYNWSSLTWDLLPDCIIKNALYHFVGKFHLHKNDIIDSVYVETRSTRTNGHAFNTKLVTCGLL